MKEIKLTRGKFAIIDDENFEKLNQFKWFVRKHGKTYYAERNSPTVNGKRYMIKMHHVIIGKPPVGLETDHEDGNGLNNQRYNLRHVTHRQNCQNKKNMTKTSMYPGVRWHKRDKIWHGYIRMNGKSKHLGNFKTEIEAFNAYRLAVNALGEKMIGA